MPVECSRARAYYGTRLAHTIDPAAILDDLRRVARELGYINSEAYHAHGIVTTQTVKNKFGSWLAACQAAGLVSRSTRHKNHEIKPQPETVRRFCLRCERPFPAIKADLTHRRCDRCKAMVPYLSANIAPGWEALG
jgi:hypothetical protein